MTHAAIHFAEDPHRLRVSWDNRDVRKDRFTFWFFLLFWIVWAPVTCAATVMIFTSGSPIFFTIWCVFGWLGTIAIPLTFAQRFWREWIQVDSDSISWGATGLMAQKPRTVPFAGVTEFGLGRYSDRHEHESMFSLNVYKSPKALGHMRRHVIGYWLSKEDKELIFARVSHFVAKRSLPLKVTIYGEA